MENLSLHVLQRSLHDIYSRDVHKTYSFMATTKWKLFTVQNWARKVELKANTLQRTNKTRIYFHNGSLYLLFNPSDHRRALWSVFR